MNRFKQKREKRKQLELIGITERRKKIRKEEAQGEEVEKKE